MVQVSWVELPDGWTWVVTGSQALDFLHNLMTQDVRSLKPGDVRYGLFLTPRGRVVADAWVTREDGTVRLFTLTGPPTTLERHLSLYRLRLDVHWEARPARTAWVFPTGPDFDRLFPEFPGWAARLPWEGGDAWLVWTEGADGGLRGDGSVEAVPMDPDVWDRWRRTLGWLWPALDLAGEEWMPLEADFYHALSYTKGCYIGQEVIAKATYLGRPPRRLLQVLVSEPTDPPPPGSSVLWRDEPRKTFGWGPAREPFTWVGWTWVPYTDVPEPVPALLYRSDGSMQSVTLRVSPWLAAIRTAYPPPPKPEKALREVRDRGR